MLPSRILASVRSNCLSIYDLHNMPRAQPELLQQRPGGTEVPELVVDAHPFYGAGIPRRVITQALMSCSANSLAAPSVPNTNRTFTISDFSKNPEP